MYLVTLMPLLNEPAHSLKYLVLSPLFLSKTSIRMKDMQFLLEKMVKPISVKLRSTNQSNSKQMKRKFTIIVVYEQGKISHCSVQ